MIKHHSDVILEITAHDPDTLENDLNAAVTIAREHAMKGGRLQPEAHHQMKTLGEDLRNDPRIRQFFALGGPDDFLIHKTAQDMDDVSHLVIEYLSSNSGRGPIGLAGRRASLHEECHRISCVMPPDSPSLMNHQKQLRCLSF